MDIDIYSSKLSVLKISLTFICLYIHPYYSPDCLQYLDFKHTLRDQEGFFKPSSDNLSDYFLYSNMRRSIYDHNEGNHLRYIHLESSFLRRI